jgi:hypothetical protein
VGYGRLVAGARLDRNGQYRPRSAQCHVHLSVCSPLGKTMARPRALLVGGASALALIGIVALLPERTKDFGLWPVAVLSVVLPALSIFLLSAPANPPLNTDARQEPPRAS